MMGSYTINFAFMVDGKEVARRTVDLMEKARLANEFNLAAEKPWLAMRDQLDRLVRLSLEWQDEKDGRRVDAWMVGEFRRTPLAALVLARLPKLRAHYLSMMNYAGD